MQQLPRPVTQHGDSLRATVLKKREDASAAKGKVCKNYVRMLNSTLCACTRLMCCILENYQTPLGGRTEVLLRYMPPALLKTDEGRKALFRGPLKVLRRGNQEEEKKEGGNREQSEEN